MAERAASREPFVPAVYQPPLPTDRLILKHGSPGAGDRTELDVLIVGAGPAGLACAIELANLAKRGGGRGRDNGGRGEGGARGRDLPVGRGGKPASVRRRFPSGASRALSYTSRRAER